MSRKGKVKEQTVEEKKQAVYRLLNSPIPASFDRRMNRYREIFRAIIEGGEPVVSDLELYCAIERKLTRASLYKADKEMRLGVFNALTRPDRPRYR